MLKHYRVMRHHVGGDGTLYDPAGENCVREAEDHDVAHLVPNTLLEIVDEAEEQPVVTENKADKPVKETKGK